MINDDQWFIFIIGHVKLGLVCHRLDDDEQDKYCSSYSRIRLIYE